MPTSCWRRFRTRNRESAYCVHQARSVLDLLVVESVDHVGGHHLADLGGQGITARRHRPHRDIAIRQHTDQALAITDGERADIEVTHLRGRFVKARLRRDDFDPRCPHIFQLPSAPPSLSRTRCPRRRVLRPPAASLVPIRGSVHRGCRRRPGGAGAVHPGSFVLAFCKLHTTPHRRREGERLWSSTTRGQAETETAGWPGAGTSRAPPAPRGRSSQNERGLVNLGQGPAPRAPRRRPRAARPLYHPTGAGPPWHKACWRRLADTQCVSILRSEALPEGGVAPDRVGLW